KVEIAADKVDSDAFGNLGVIDERRRGRWCRWRASHGRGRRRKHLFGNAVCVLIERSHAQTEPVETAGLAGKRRIEEERRAIRRREADADGTRLEDDIFEDARARIELGLPNKRGTMDDAARIVGICRTGDAAVGVELHLQYLTQGRRIVSQSTD